MKTLSGVALIGFAVFLCVFNVMDVVADLKQWHDATNPQMFAAIMKQIASVGMAAFGGTLMPVPGGGIGK